jgi:hypothetical protein
MSALRLILMVIVHLCFSAAVVKGLSASGNPT